MSSKTTIFNTEFTPFSFQGLIDYLLAQKGTKGAKAIDFTNTHILTMRWHEKKFHEATKEIDRFVPDGIPIYWILKKRGIPVKEHLRGPSFLPWCIQNSPPDLRHFFLGGTQNCLDRLIKNCKAINPKATICGSHHGYFQPNEEENIQAEIQKCEPDIIWVGLGTPKQQKWISQWKASFEKGCLIAVGYAFDVCAGTKPDAPIWIQRNGLNWLYRIWQEPKRLTYRYLKWNSLFIWYWLTTELQKKDSGLR